MGLIIFLVTSIIDSDIALLGAIITVIGISIFIGASYTFKWGILTFIELVIGIYIGNFILALIQKNKPR